MDDLAAALGNLAVGGTSWSDITEAAGGNRRSGRDRSKVTKIAKAAIEAGALPQLQ